MVDRNAYIHYMLTISAYNDEPPDSTSVTIQQYRCHHPVIIIFLTPLWHDQGV